MVSRHGADRLKAHPTSNSTRTTGWHRGIRIVLALLTFALASIAGQPHADAMPEGPARPASAISTRYEGLLRGIRQGTWTVGEKGVQVDQQTVVVEKRGKAEIGAWVIVWGQQDEAGQLRAEVISVDRPAAWTAPIVQISGMLRKQAATWWVVEQQLIEITSDTLISGEPKIGELVWVVAIQQGDTLRGLAVEVLAQSPENPPVEFEGTIQAFSSFLWQVDGRAIIVDENTRIYGVPTVGWIAEVQASQLADGRLLAQMIRVVDPTAEVTLSAMVAEITAAEDGTQNWDVVVFPKSLWAEPTIGTVRVSNNTYVDESRAIARTGQWVEVRGVNLGGEAYQADVIRMERPIPVSLTGEIQPAPGMTTGDGWGQIKGQPVWLGAVQPEGAMAQAIAGGNVAVVGVRLSNGVIWAQQVRSVGQ